MCNYLRYIYNDNNNDNTNNIIIISTKYTKGVSMMRIQSIQPEERKKLKKSVDEIGRQLVAESLNYRYQTLTHKLNGQLPISQEEYEKINSKCIELKSH